jgi:hypothetical protein
MIELPNNWVASTNRTVAITRGGHEASRPPERAHTRPLGEKRTFGHMSLNHFDFGVTTE